MDAANAKPLPLLSRRLRRWQDAKEMTNEGASKFFGVALRTYTGCLYGEHFPRGLGKAFIEKKLTSEERKLKLPPITNEPPCL